MVNKRSKLALAAFGIALVPAFALIRAHGSDHADTPAIAADPSVDLTDVFVFPSPNNPNNVVLVMDVHPLIPTGQAGNVSFDPNVLYQFKIDNTGDGVEDLVLQTRVVGTGANQQIFMTGPVKPPTTGTVNTGIQTSATFGTLNKTYSPSDGITVFAGAREDPFFFDLDQFFKILPDRATPLTGVPDPTPNTPKAASFRPPGEAKDFLAGYNVLSIVVELPKSSLVGSGSGKIGVWCTTSR